MKTAGIAVALVIVSLALVGSARPACAQGVGRVVVTADAPIFVVPDVSRTPLRVARQGTILVVVEETDGWFRVEFSDPQWGRRVGYIQREHVRPAAADYSSMTPMDLSVPDGPAGERTSPRRGERETYASAPDRTRGFFDVTLGGARADSRTFSNFVSIPIRSETFDADATYEISSGALFEIGGGFMATPNLGFGVTLSGTAYLPDVTTSISVPDIFAFDNFAEDQAVREELERVEGAVHLQLVLAVDLSPNATLRIIGGPTYFRLEQELVNNLTVAEGFLPHRVEIRDIETAKYDGTGWGYNVGADLAYYFTRRFGIGGLVRYAKGKVELPVALGELFSDETFDYPVGGLHVGGGLRIRF